MFDCKRISSPPAGSGSGMPCARSTKEQVYDTGKLMMQTILKRFEKIIILSLLAMMMLAVGVSAVELAVILFQQLMEPPKFLLNINEMLEVFGFFMMVLIGIELLETIKAYLERDKIHVEVVILVAIVAVSRKIVIMDYKKMEPEILFGMAALILGLAGGYYLVKKTLGR